VHQETDRTAVDPEYRLRAAHLEHFVERLEHEAVSAEGDQRFRIVNFGKRVAAAKQSLSRLSDLRVRGLQTYPEIAKVLVRMAGRTGRIRVQPVAPSQASTSSKIVAVSSNVTVPFRAVAETRRFALSTRPLVPKPC